jgi:putative salt-induced outer membrane protein YdiY
MRTPIAVLSLALAGPAALAQDAQLPSDLQTLLEAAAAAEDADAFASAVSLIALTQPAEAVAGGAAQISAERAALARDVLGLEPAMVAEVDAPPQARTEPRPAWRAAPAAVANAVVSGESEVWSGEARLGVRNDSGNSDRQDYTLGLAAERALAVWGFSGELSYAYSEVDGAVGRDEVLAAAQLDREAGERWTLYANSEYRSDALSGFDYSAILGAGAGYRVFAGENLAWTLEAGPAVRIVAPQTRDTKYEPALDLGSSFEAALSQAVTFSAETSALISDSSRAEQRFALDTALGALWALRFSYQYTYEFEPEPGFKNADSRTDLEIVREF